MRKLKTAKDKPTKEDLDDLVREILRIKYKQSQVCGSKKHLLVSHFITRSNYAVRWDLDNVYWLCSGCHTMRRTAWHKDPAGAVDFVKGFLGDERYRELRMRASTVGQKIDKWTVKVYLEQELKKLKRGKD